MQFFPAWLLNPSKIIPLLNWQLGPVTVYMSEGSADQAKRGIGVEIGIESCSGAMLLSRVPFMRILVEIRVGLLHVTLGRQNSLVDNEPNADSENGIAKYKWISSDYIRAPDDGFLYIGLKYSAQEATGKPNGRVQFVGNLEEELGLKGRLCIGPINIDCNEAAMRTAIGQDVVNELLPSIMDIAASTHLSVLQNAYHNFVELVANLPKKGSRGGNGMIPRATKTLSTYAQEQQTSTDNEIPGKDANRTRILNALLLRSSTFEVEVGSLELNLSTFTSHIENVLHGQVPMCDDLKPSETREDVNVLLPATTYRLQNRPSMNECIVDVAGARIIYRSTKQGRAAVVRHLTQLFKV
ncbi:hypothetical protein PHMEG_00013635 [Phytophthora megakarya]|uniref:Uncharacterized protein n=1 Tax=Phytophthora megakarya TaxID=4795 RepID=A0A225W7F5_9STRA|nr:hypothetical protein PHMEG_00013635 [Phytophthora megakarya]